MDPDGLAPEAQYRIGAVSRLAGVPVTTLRVWETRYGAFAPAKSSGRHRLYTEADVLKARLVRQLTAAGHAAGQVARLEVPRLQQMLGATQEAAGASQAAAGPRRVTCAVVGAALSARVNAPEWRRRHLPEGLDVRQVFTGLEALLASPAQAVELLLVRVNVVHRSMQDQLLRAMDLWQAPRAILLYNYGAAPALEALQRAGVLLRREPLADADLAHLVRSGLVVDAARSLAPNTPGATIPPRRYSDEDLARVAASPSSVMCECPRHIAELITQLAGFEAYSQQCLNATDDDAQLHAYLRSVAGSARALFEQALEMAARHGGLELPQR